MRSACLLLVLPLISCENLQDARLRAVLTFHASFDAGADADFALGEPRIFTSAAGMSPDVKPGLHREHAKLVPAGEGRGQALRFTDNEKATIYFAGKDNMPYERKAWSATISMWLRLDPDADLKPGFADPIQITDKTWNDASIFLDFTKDDDPRHFRLGVFCDKSVWNPESKKLDEIPAAEHPFVIVEKTPLSRDRWTHAVITLSGFNRDEETGTACLYLDGKLHGSIEGKRQIFSWDPSKTRIFLGLNYIGDIDDLAIFRRALSPAQIDRLGELGGHLSSIHGGANRPPPSRP
jgi:hypothetical protein